MKTDIVRRTEINVIGMDQASDQICFHLGAPKPFSEDDHSVIHITKSDRHLGGSGRSWGRGNMIKIVCEIF